MFAYRLLLLCSLVLSSVMAFTPVAPVSKPMTSLSMGMFDFFGDAFKNEDFDDRRATAAHILVETEEEALVVQKSIEDGTETFESAAKSYSTCPSSSKGGSLGTFEPGVMVAEFDDVVFNSETPIGQLLGPIKTQFGYHLIVVQDKFENAVKSDGEGFF